MQLQKSHLLIAVCVLAILAVIVWRAALAPHALRVTILPVGKSSVVLLQTPSGEVALLNTGSDASILRALGTELPMWHRTIDLLVLTNMKSIYAGGAQSVFERYHIGTLVRSAAQGSYTQEAILTKAEQKNPYMKVLVAMRGTRVAFSDGVILDTLWPDRDASGMNTDDGALVVRVSYGATSFLIDELPPRPDHWRTDLDVDLTPATITIATSTPAGTYVSDGRAVREVK